MDRSRPPYRRYLTGGLVFLVTLAAARTGGAAPLLRVCADPNNLPFSNAKGEGLENALARLVAHELGAELAYAWMPQRRGFVRTTLNAGLCDVIMEVPAGYERTATTRPYYESRYVFVSRQDRHLAIRSLDDPALSRLRIGVQLVGDDYANPPPVEALSRRGLTDRVVGFPVYGDYAKPNPLAPIMQAVERGEVDLAIVWGPLAGWWARQGSVPLTIAPVSPATDRDGLPLSFRIAMGVRRGDSALRDRLDLVLRTRRREIEAILRSYGVPSSSFVTSRESRSQ